MNDDGTLPPALLLAALAGWVDAAGIASSGRIFLSFMSGNTTDLAASVVHADWRKAATIAAVILLFVAGVAAGERLDHLTRRHGHSWVLGFEALCLAAGAAIEWHGSGLPASFGLYPLVFAMGLQNAAMHRVDGIGIGTTYVTGTIVQIGRIIGGAEDRKKLMDYITLWLSLALGAAGGAWTVSLAPVIAWTIAAGVALGLAIIAAARA
jgi:uncharacterized membrane protein YoaK (UPF0700 family)